MNSFTPIPNEWIDQLADGRLNPLMYLILTYLMRTCDWKTGKWRGTAERIVYGLNGEWSISQINRMITRLHDCAYIVRRNKPGKRGGYTILINNYQVPNAQEEITLRRVETRDWQDDPEADAPEVRGRCAGDAPRDASEMRSNPDLPDSDDLQTLPDDMHRREECEEVNEVRLAALASHSSTGDSLALAEQDEDEPFLHGEREGRLSPSREPKSKAKPEQGSADPDVTAADAAFNDLLSNLKASYLWKLVYPVTFRAYTADEIEACMEVQGYLGCNGCPDPRALLEYNRTHKPPRLAIKSFAPYGKLAGMLKAVSESNLVTDCLNHSEEGCRDCKTLARKFHGWQDCGHCGRIKVPRYADYSNCLWCEAEGHVGTADGNRAFLIEED